MFSLFLGGCFGAIQGPYSIILCGERKGPTSIWSALFGYGVAAW